MFFGEKLNVKDCFSLVKTKMTSNGVESCEQDIEALKFKGKTIVVLCGNHTRDPLRAGSYSNYCYGWLKGCEESKHINIYSIFYPNNQPLLNLTTPNPEIDYEGLSKILFKQVLCKNNKYLPAEEVSKKLGDITFFGHSAGGLVMNELMNNLGEMMKENGYTLKDIEKVYSSIVFVGYSPYSLVDAPINSVYIAPIYDSVGSTKLAYNRLKESTDFESSNPNFDPRVIFKSKDKASSSFINFYRSDDNMVHTVYFKDDKSLIAVPNLLFNDGYKEDHNLAGVINYYRENPKKTKAGKLTTSLLNNVLTYSVNVDRNEFSVNDLFVEAKKEVDKESNIDKEL